MQLGPDDPLPAERGSFKQLGESIAPPQSIHQCILNAVPVHSHEPETEACAMRFMVSGFMGLDVVVRASGRAEEDTYGGFAHGGLTGGPRGCRRPPCDAGVGRFALYVRMSR